MKHIPDTDEVINPKKGEQITITDRETDDKGWKWCLYNGKGGWIPEKYIEKAGKIYRMKVDYTSKELHIPLDEVVDVLKMESNWAFVSSSAGKGWLPMQCIKEIKLKKNVMLDSIFDAK